jgi:Zn-dependent protease
MNARISSSELVDLLIAYVVLTVAFGIMFSGVSLLGSMSLDALSADMFIVSAIGVGTGFLLHELAHKFTAIRYGYQAEFRADMSGLFLTIIMSVLGFIIAAPGAVMISGRPSNPNNPYEYNGGNQDDDEYWDRLTNRRVNSHELHISIAGVIVNLIMAALFLVLMLGHFVPWHIAYHQYLVLDDLTAQIAFTGLRINIVLAAFNMIPFGPLDGAKVLRANPLVWAAIGLPVIFGWLLLMFNPGLLFSILLGV